MDTRPIGIFDSGVGGLTVFKELHALMPHEDFIYFGDTGRVPYGTRSRETILKYASEDMAFLLSHGVKMVVAACGTASAVLTNKETDRLPVSYTGVIIPSAQAAAVATSTGNVGVIGTPATVRSGAYGRAMRNVRSDIKVTGHACPLFVPLVEAGMFEEGNPVARELAKIYLSPFLGSTVDTLILGCTHYPMLAGLIGKMLGPGIRLINPGAETARYTLNHLMARGMLQDPAHQGICRYYCTDSPEGFAEVAEKFFGSFDASQVTRVELEELSALSKEEAP